MSAQPEALQIIQHMDDEWQEDWDGARIRAELRRLHEVNQELLEALKELVQVSAHLDACQATVEVARAAIAKATGEQA